MLRLFVYIYKIALVAELVDALDSKSSSFGSVGSIPTQGTNDFNLCFYFRIKVLGKLSLFSWPNLKVSPFVCYPIWMRYE
jgi:hypothetical protein